MMELTSMFSLFLISISAYGYYSPFCFEFQIIDKDIVQY